MSKDNGVYVFEARDGYYVILAHAVENVFVDPDFKAVNKQTLAEYLIDSTHYYNREEALDYAKEIAERVYVEHGICIVNIENVDVKEDILKGYSDEIVYTRTATQHS